MLSESARMSSAAEARFRVQAPNAAPRTIKVIALDEVSDAVVRRLAAAAETQAAFFTAITPETGGGDASSSASQTPVVRDLAGRIANVVDEINSADLVALVAGPGGHASAAPAIGRACSQQRVMPTGFIVGAASAGESELSKTLAQLRPWSLMVVIANDDNYLEEMMSALRA
jgi:hypothetical protein